MKSVLNNEFERGAIHARMALLQEITGDMEDVEKALINEKQREEKERKMKEFMDKLKKRRAV